MSKRYDDPIEVETGDPGSSGGPPARRPGRLKQPVAFCWRGRRYPVQRLLKYWREAGEGWDPERVRDHECFRVEAEGGIYDLRLDLLAGGDGLRWRLARVWD